MIPRVLFASLALAALPAPATAQRLYRAEVGGALAYNVFDKSATDLKSAVGGAIRGGYWITRFLSAEGEFAIARTGTVSADSGISVHTLSGFVLYNFPVGLSSSAFLKAGYQQVSYNRSVSCSVQPVGGGPCGSAGAIIGGIGFRLAISPTLLLRTEATVNRSSTFIKFSNFSLSSGVSLMLGSKKLTDSDEDRVYDRYDHCLGTPPGALVDKHGCPTDSDDDGVFDGLDRCPNTPPGATVDPVGCTGDEDGDGVLDGLDQCPATPHGAIVDAKGCPRDSDGDGVFDGLDRCAKTPPGATVDALGCPGDADNDGVFDGIDKCPDTPSGTPVNAFGCPPNQDSDKDGVPDAVDRCPGTPQGTPVGRDGCPVANVPGGEKPPPGQARPEEGAGRRDWVVPGKAFALKSSKLLLLEARPVLDSVAAALGADSSVTALIVGYAQDRLVPPDNLRLSKQRADSVRAYLVRKGLPENRLMTEGRGSSKLIVSDTTEAAREVNRRVEIRLGP